MSPKDKFLLNRSRAEHMAAVLGSLEMSEACDAAMLEMLSNLGRPSDGNAAAATEYRRQGAQLFLETLKTIATPPKPATDEQIGVLKRTH